LRMFVCLPAIGSCSCRTLPSILCIACPHRCSDYR
jgi:hypothetical protein